PRPRRCCRPGQQPPPGRGRPDRRPGAAAERRPADRHAGHHRPRPGTGLLRTHPHRRRTPPCPGAGMNAALVVEALKLRRSPAGLLATGALLAGTRLLLGGITAAVADGNPQIIATAGPAASLAGPGPTAAAALITSRAGLPWRLGPGFAAGSITGRLALPVSRGRSALAMLVVYAGWVLPASITLPLGVPALGLLPGYGRPGAEVGGSLA